jgi:hypothetical protein
LCRRRFHATQPAQTPAKTSSVAASSSGVP